MEEKKTCLYDNHVALGAKMSPFGGFIMPIEYSSIIEEHNAVRNNCGMFDVSHMGEVFVSGNDAEKFVNYIFTNDITDAPIGKIYYGMMLNPAGGVVDDLLVYKIRENYFLLVINAANIDKDVAWISHNATEFDVVVNNQSDHFGQLAVQGPEAEGIVKDVLKFDVAPLEFYTFAIYNNGNEDILVSRTGYTGEDGFEIYGSHAYIVEAWDKFLATGKVAPCGLGCRDTLRFEAALPLYGHELTDEITPIEAGLGMFVKLDKPDFIGRDVIERQKAEGVSKKVVGIEIKDRAIPRAGYDIEVEGRKIGTVTTGYHTISTDRSVCLALIDSTYAKLDTPVDVRIRKKVFPGTVVKKKFYEKKYKK